jgi:hypothetical protein
LPREENPGDTSAKRGLPAVLEKTAKAIGDVLKTVGGWIEDLVRWLTQNKRPAPPPNSSSNWSWLSAFLSLSVFQWLLILLIIALLVVLAMMLYRAWQRRQARPEVIAAEMLAATPDLADENLSAQQLPEEGWLQLASQLIAQGDLRLALRALYLASLAHLAGRDLITLAKFKSNRDYERELARRRHALPELASLFTENVSVFDRVWYGVHQVNRELLDHFARNVERIKASP